MFANPESALNHLVEQSQKAMVPLNEAQLASVMIHNARNTIIIALQKAVKFDERVAADAKSAAEPAVKPV
jgi:hypothetical protein